MEVLPTYVFLGFGVGLFIIVLVQNFRLALSVLLTLGKAAVVVVVIALAGSLLGLWELPQNVAVLPLGIQRIWRPLQQAALEWFRGLFP